jgi:hypothetical protein
VVQLEKHLVPLDTIFSFVIMSSNFDYKDNYVERVTNKNVADLDMYPRQKDFLLYLSMLTYYCNRGGAMLPEMHCKKIIDPKGGYVPVEFMEMICPASKLFLIEEKIAGVKFIRVPHLPAAKCLFTALSENVPKHVILNKLLKEPVIRSPYLRDKVHLILRRLLVQRPFKDSIPDGSELQKFSYLVMEITENEGVQHAIEVLKTGCSVLDDTHKSYIGQGLARLLKDEMQLPQAKKCIKDAIKHAEATNVVNLFTCHDTYGQIFKVELGELEKVVKSKDGGYDMKDLGNALEVAYNGCLEFSQAVELFRQKKTFVTRGVTYDQVFIGDFSAMMGEMHINLTILDLILSTNLFKKKDLSLSSKFLKLLRNGLDLETLEKSNGRKLTGEEYLELQELTKLFNNYNIRNTYSKLKDHLAEAVRRVTNSQSLIAQIERNCERFNDLFSENIMEVEFMKLLDSKLDSNEKLKKLRAYLLPVVTHNCRWVMSRPIDTLRNYQRAVLGVEKLVEETGGSKTERHDMLSYMAVYFALLRHDHDRILLEEQKVKEICKHFVIANETNHTNFYLEAFIFFILLFWPAKKGKIDINDEKLFRYCIDRLAYIYPKCQSRDVDPYVYFRLKISQKKVIISGRHKNKLGYQFNGRTDAMRKVGLKLPGFKDQIKIPIELARKRRRSTENFADVKFHMDITQHGPIARIYEYKLAGSGSD